MLLPPVYKTAEFIAQISGCVKHKYSHMDRHTQIGNLAGNQTNTSTFTHTHACTHFVTWLFNYSDFKRQASNHNNCRLRKEKMKKKKKKNPDKLKSLCDGLMLLFTLQQQQRTLCVCHSHSANSDHLLQTPWRHRNVTKPVNCDQFCLCRWTRTRSLSASVYLKLQHTCTHTQFIRKCWAAIIAAIRHRK